MTDSVSDSIYEAIASIRLIDPHTHINPYAPASNTLADLLGYHYYTELAHSAGMPKARIEAEGLSPRDLVHRLVANLSPIDNTAQYRWLIEICRMFFGFNEDRIDLSNWEALYDSAEKQMRLAEWPQLVLDQSNVEAVFLTNDFDDTLDGFDTDTYIPCLRTDDLVFHLSKLQTQERLRGCSEIDLDGSLTSLRRALTQRFDHFVSRDARACAISLPPNFEPTRVADGRAKSALNEVLRKGSGADPSHQTALSRHVFWTLAELCDEYGLPFDLMIGVNRGVYSDGVYQGRDLYDSRVSLIQYRELFNAFPAVKFPISVLASVTNQELVSYAWIFPNVLTNGHWWYSNTPSFIARDAAARLEAVPRTKQIAYYSDAYKLEFVWPKFDMYRRILANILAEHFVKSCRLSEELAIELGRQVLRGNVDTVFPKPQPGDLNNSRFETMYISSSDTVSEDTWVESALETASSLGAGTIPSLATDQDTEDPVEFSTRISDTVRMEESESGELDTMGTVDLDPLPSDEEIKTVGIDDVELIEPATPEDRDLSNDSTMDAEPLDVGDLLGEEEEDAGSSKIRMLRGNTSFQPDEDSLRLRPDPVTGELRFQLPGDDDDNSNKIVDEDEIVDPDNPSKGNDD